MPSSDDEAIFLPFGEKLTLVTLSECPSRVSISTPVVLSTKFTASVEIKAIVLPSGENLSLLTPELELTLKVLISFPVSISNNWTALWEAKAIILLSGDKPICKTEPLAYLPLAYFSRVLISFPVALSQSLNLVLIGSNSLNTIILASEETRL